MEKENTEEKSVPASSGGKGDTPVLGLKCRDTRMIERAIRQGWDIPEDAFKKLPEQMLHIAEFAESERSRISAAKALVAMHGQNQDMQPKELNHRHEIVVVEDEGWYGNDAHTEAAETIETSATGPAIPGEVQSGCVRETVGEDGDGPADGDAGPREDEGAAGRGD